MSVPKMTAALLGLLVPGILAITPYANGQYTMTAEPQQVGSTTSDGMLVYSINYCTIVQDTQCQVFLSTANAVTPESSVTVAPTDAASTVVAESSAVVSDPASAPATGETIIPGEPEQTTFVSEVTPGAPESTEAGIPVTAGQPTPTVVSTTDEVGNPTFVTSTALAVTGSDAAATSGTASESASSTTGHHSNSTSSGEHDGPSTTTDPSAPSPTGAGAALRAIPGVILGATVMAAIFLV